METKYKKGQKVWTFSHGWGVVEEIVSDADNYPVLVKFEDCNASFTHDGRELWAEKPTLLFKEVFIPDSAFEPPIEYEELFVGDVVLLKNDTFAWVAEHSGPGRNAFHYHLKVPNFDESFGFNVTTKDQIKKKLGNTGV